MSEVHKESDLLARLTNGCRSGERFIFMLGTGVTVPSGGYKGVPGTAGVLALVLETFRDDPEVLGELQSESSIARAYQRAFRSLHARRGPQWVNHLIRSAVLEARTNPESQPELIDFLKDPFSIRNVRFIETCAALERDPGWSLRPGLEAFGQIVTEFRESFGATVLTTNFDPLITVAIHRAKGRTLKTVLPIDGSPSLASAPDSTHVIHIHGDWSGLDTLHSEAILDTPRPHLENYIRNALSNSTIVVLGYGGWNDSFMRALQNATQDPQLPFNVLWAFRTIEPTEYIVDRLSQSSGKTKIVFYTDIDADSLLVKLHKQLQSDKQKADKSTNTLPSEGAPPESPNGRVSNAHRISDANFQQQVRRDQRILDLLIGKGAKVHTVLSPDQRHTMQEPNFLLFERSGQIIMTIAPTEEGIDLDRLQRTDWPKVRCRALTSEEVIRLGFPNARVHPMFRDPEGLITKIFWDADLLVQSILFPESEIALPIYGSEDSRRDEQKVVASIEATLKALIAVHGREKIEFANVQARGRKHGWVKWRNRILRKLLESSPFHTRFAPTPSNSLHLGNARTAIATYLLARGGGTAPSHSATEGDIPADFYLRFDDTDSKRLDIGNLPTIKSSILNELQWLGIQLSENKRFSQSASSSFTTYANIEKLLVNRGLAIRDCDGVSLREIHDAHYFNVWLDWLEGPKVSHRPPQAVESSTFLSRNKPIKIWRKPHEDPYYRFAGIIDDIRELNAGRRLNYVLRDCRQEALCHVQSHIRGMIEHARVGLGEHDDDRNLLLAAGIDPDRPVPLPIYCLVQVVVVNGQPLKKSKALEDYMIGTLRNRCTLPESITSYAIATLLSFGALGWKKQLQDVSAVFGLLGVKAGLDYHADRFSLDYLTRTHEQYDCTRALADIAASERIVLRCMPYWSFIHHLKQYVPSAKLDQRVMARMYDNLSEMASWAQVVHLLSGPRVCVRVPHADIVSIRAILADSETSTIALLQEMRASVRRELGRGNGNARQRFHSLLGSFRRILVGEESSPKIEIAISILGVQRVLERLDNAVSISDRDG